MPIYLRYVSNSQQRSPPCEGFRDGMKYLDLAPRHMVALANPTTEQELLHFVLASFPPINPRF
jgi:hypothetical protein